MISPSPQNVFFLLFLLMHCWMVTAKTHSADLAVLKSLKEKWLNTPPSWIKRDPCQKWEGVSCFGTRVTSIILSGANLTGTLPDEIVLLADLRILDLSNNKGLTGFLPANIGRLKNLVKIALIGCNFSGSIPESIGSLPQLSHLFLSSNRFSGLIPRSIGNLTNLIWLDLSDNQLDGAIPISNRTSPGLDLLLKAEHFHLGNNNLYGEIPLGLLSSKMSLKHLILNHNKLIGSIPDTLGLVLTLKVIRLDRNELSGPVPQNLGDLINMKELSLANNNLSGPLVNVSGMNHLAYVDLSNNSFEAAVLPQWFTTLLNLTTLRMEGAGLEEEIPTALLSLPSLQTLILKNNKLKGTMDLGNSFSSELVLIDLRHNYIDEFDYGRYKNDILLDDNPFCMKPKAKGLCKTSQVSKFSSFVPESTCIPSSCFSDVVLGPTCRRPYLGSLVFRSFNFSDLRNVMYYRFLDDTLKPILTNVGVPIKQLCLGKSMISDGNLVLNIAFFPPDGVYFNRTGISTIGNLFNIHIFTTPYGPYVFIDLTYSFSGESGRGQKNIGIIIGLTIGGFLLLLLSISVGLYAYQQRKKAGIALKFINPFSSYDPDNIPHLNSVRCFSLEDVNKYTNNFQDGSEIGVGGYGKVYRGRLDTGLLVAIKRAQRGSLQGALEFKTEIELLSRVHHKNVVNLVGFCSDEGEQMLIYEYAPKGSLRAVLSGKSEVQLNWWRRLTVALGAARGLVYLHDHADPPIIHRDVKSCNILLDDNFNAKVADFGLSRALRDGKDNFTTELRGTMGYLDPEYVATGQQSEKSDVYSFGVVMLELVTGRLPLENMNYIVKDVLENMYKAGNIYNLLDPAISSDSLIGLTDFVDLALKCVQNSGANRPTMGEIVKELEHTVQASTLTTSTPSTTEEGNHEGYYSDRIQKKRLLQSFKLQSS